MTEVFCVSVTKQEPVPLQAPDQPAKKEVRCRSCGERDLSPAGKAGGTGL